MNTFDQKWKRHFQEFAAKYDDDAGIAGWSPTGLQTRMKHFQSLIKQHPVHGSLWLDIGCGAGSYSRLLARRGVTVIGMDYSFETLLKAKERSQSEVYYIMADANNLPFKQEAFDGIVCFGLLQAVSSPNIIIKECKLCLKTKGQLWIDALNFYNLYTILKLIDRWIRRKNAHLKYYKPRSISYLLQKYNIFIKKKSLLPVLPSAFKYHCNEKIYKLLNFTVYRYYWLGLLFSHSFVFLGIKHDHK